ncbi:major facilitator superfamily domain-containing protein 6 [Spodoptera frugiperda]|uniref:Major facilitator superfamily domain-containing protein 6 n=1 Tax=Spodoptera frugiperda TaxID=7108 RepID=A0A9R0EG15_SPOFR|nr:major facilitator superfamily domain-containing protein 6 [Spodoptera frugiperda]
MLLSKMNVNKKLLYIKGHYFFFNAGTAPLVPYLSTYARQLGFSSATVGLIYTILPIFGLIAKPLFGIIADRFKKQKSLFILFQIITIISFGAIYFIPENRSLTVELDCDGGITMLQSCYKSKDAVDNCKVDYLSNLSLNATSRCEMNCDMTSPKMWQTVCEHWHIPQYCYSNTNNIRYSSIVNKVTLKNDSCAYIAAGNVTLDGHVYSPRCRLGEVYVDVNEPCSFKCDNTKLSTAIGKDRVNMTCIDQNINYKLCPTDTVQLKDLTTDPLNSTCEASCDLDVTTPWRLMEICEWWKADTSSYCQPKTRQGEEFPKNLSFTGEILLSSTIQEHECVYMRLHQIELPMESGVVTKHYPVCGLKGQYEEKSDLFLSSCNIRCDNAVVNELIEGASDSRNDKNELTSTFWLFFVLMILSWIGQAVVVTFADAICFNLLGTKVTQYGKQRLWGSVGWGIFSLLTGFLIDTLSDGDYKNYSIAFILMFVFMMGDVAVSCFLETDSTRMSVNILADVGSLLSSLPTVLFLLWTIAVGLCTGLLWQFLFWLLEDISGLTCDGSGYIKTLQGLVSAIQTFGGEIPFLFVSGYVLKKVGHINMMSLVLLAFGVRFILYSLLSNPWWVLPIEMLQGVTFGMFYPTMTSYANFVSPPGTETTVQGLVGAVFEGVGTSLGSLIGGQLYGTYGGWITFRSFGIGAIICCGLNWLAFFILKDKIALVPSGYSSVIRYEQGNDMIFMLEDM